MKILMREHISLASRKEALVPSVAWESRTSPV